MEMEFKAVDSQTSLSEYICEELERMHNEAFPPEEQHFTADFFIEENGRDGYHLWLARLKGALIGYSFLQIIVEHKIAVIWYMAVDKKWRNHGMGREMVQGLIKEMESDPAPVRYMFLESRTPENDAPSGDFDRRRLAFYRSLGAHWIRGVDYAIPSYTDPRQSIRYELMFFPIAGQINDGRVKQAIRRIADDAYTVGDPRAARFEKSLADMYIQPPPGILG
jgi:ribosomal protein S18 acetylase RimI-like enzyme